MKVYHCKGDCSGVSTSPGSCQAENCSMKGQPLEEVDQCDMCAAKMAEEGAQPAVCSKCKQSE